MPVRKEYWNVGILEKKAMFTVTVQEVFKTLRKDKSNVTDHRV